MAAPDIETYRQELERLAELTDSVERDLKIAQLARAYGLPAARISEHLKPQTPGDKETPLIDADDFLSEDTKPPDFLVPELLPKGEVVLLAALPKIGKTLLAIDLLHSVVYGGEFLGETIKPGRALLVSVDESIHSTRLKLRQRGFKPPLDGTLKIATNWDFTQLDKLTEWVQDFKPDLVVIDSLRAAYGNVKISENDSEFAAPLYKLKDLFAQHEVAGLVIHHESKSADSQGINRVRGSGAITAAVWGIWQLKGGEGTGRTLEATLRDCPGQSMNLTLDEDTYHWQRYLEPEEKQTRSALERVVAILRERGGLELEEVYVLVGGNRSTVRSALNRGVKRGILTKRESSTRPGEPVYSCTENGACCTVAPLQHLGGDKCNATATKPIPSGPEGCCTPLLQHPPATGGATPLLNVNDSDWVEEML